MRWSTWMERIKERHEDDPPSPDEFRETQRLIGSALAGLSHETATWKAVYEKLKPSKGEKKR